MLEGVQSIMNFDLGMAVQKGFSKGFVRAISGRKILVDFGQERIYCTANELEIL